MSCSPLRYQATRADAPGEDGGRDHTIGDMEWRCRYKRRNGYGLAEPGHVTDAAGHGGHDDGPTQGSATLRTQEWINPGRASGVGAVGDQLAAGLIVVLHRDLSHNCAASRPGSGTWARRRAGASRCGPAWRMCARANRWLARGRQLRAGGGGLGTNSHVPAGRLAWPAVVVAGGGSGG